MNLQNLQENFIYDVKIGDHLLANNNWCIVDKITENNGIKLLKIYIVNGKFYTQVSIIIPLYKMLIYLPDQSEPLLFNLQKWKSGLVVPFHISNYKDGLKWLDNLEL